MVSVLPKRPASLRTRATAGAVLLAVIIGLILGHCVIGSIWALINLLLGIPTFSVWI